MKNQLNDMDTMQINDYLGKYPGYGGCYSCLLLPKKIEKKVYVVNMDIRKNGSGTHWVMVDNYSTPKRVIYFDPFGLPPNTYTQKFMETAKDKACYYSDQDYQNVKSRACGYFCCFVAEQILRDRKTFRQVLKDFKENTTKNERLLEDYFIKNSTGGSAEEAQGEQVDRETEEADRFDRYLARPEGRILQSIMTAYLRQNPHIVLIQPPLRAIEIMRRAQAWFERPPPYDAQHRII